MKVAIQYDFRQDFEEIRLPFPAMQADCS